MITETDAAPPARPAPFPWPSLDLVGDAELIERLPCGLAVLDLAATVRHANPALLDEMGIELADVVGRSFLHLVDDADDVAVLAELLADREPTAGATAGPAAIRYVGADGRPRAATCSIRRLVDRSGFLLVLSQPSVTDALADAVRSLRRAERFETVAELLAASLCAHPLSADGVVLRFGDGTPSAAPMWPLGDDLLTDGGEMAPWWSMVRNGSGFDLDLGDPCLAALPGPVAERMGRQGYRSIWCRPVVDGHGVVAAALVALRRAGGAPDRHQRRALDDVAGAAGLALDQLAYRATLRRGAFVDPLTGVGASARLDEAVAAGISGSAVVHLDLDGFADLNDTYGRSAGDHVLREVADRLTSILRSDDLVIRVGGDEFVLVIRAVSELESVRIAARIVDELARPYPVVGADDDQVLVPATASVGLCVQGDDTPFEVALDAADEALSSAKRDGRRRMHVVSR